MGITDLTMTSERESGVDFTIPFMSLGKNNPLTIGVIFISFCTNFRNWNSVSKTHEGAAKAFLLYVTI